MGIFDRFPYSSTHEMNLDFMLGKATEIAESLQEVQDGLSDIDTHKAQAEQAAQAAQASQAAASASAGQAAQHKTDAEDAADRAEAASTEAETAADRAETALGNITNAETVCTEAAEEAQQYAEASQTHSGQAQIYKNAAEAAKNSAELNASQAATSAGSAANSATDSASSANSANVSATNASLQASNAATSATNAATSETNAATSETNAAASASAAAASEEQVETLVESLPEDFTDLNNTVNDISDEIDFYFKNGNNVAPLEDFTGTYRGITFTVKNGIITLSGTSTGTIRSKLSNGYVLASEISSDWKSQTLPQFETGKTYCMKNIFVRGTMRSDVGVSLRGPDGASVIGASTPEATIAETPAFLMIYIPLGLTMDVSFIPMFMEGNRADTEPIYKQLNPLVAVNQPYIMPDLTQNFVYNSTIESAIKFPDTYTINGKPTPLIIMCHGLNSTISASTWGGSDMETLVSQFTNAGYAVIDVNQITAQDWCNPNLIKRYVTAINNAIRKYNIVPKIIFGESMGSLIGLCISSMYKTIVACVIAGIRLDFAARYAELTTAQKAIVDTNLGFTNGFDAYIASGWDKLAISCNGNNNTAICPSQFPPTLFIVGSSDTTTKTESLAKIEQIKRGGTICETKEYTGDHNAVCYLKTETSFTDAMAWMNTWNN